MRRYTTARNLAQQLRPRAIVALLSKSLRMKKTLISFSTKSLGRSCRSPRCRLRLSRLRLMEPNRKGCGYACGVILLRAHACWKIGRNTVLVSDIASLNLNTRLAPSIWHIAARPDSVAPAFQNIPGSCRPELLDSRVAIERRSVTGFAISLLVTPTSLQSTLTL